MSYFDNNATTPAYLSVIQALTAAAREDWQNPSSPYRSANRTKAKLSNARIEWADTLGVDSSHIIFSSGATEANNWVIASAAQNHPLDSRIMISSLEHPSVEEPARFWFKDRVEVMPNLSAGTVCLDSLIQKLDHDRHPVLLCMMAANNESGVIQPWLEVARICKHRNIPFHCDATQWVGKMRFSDLHHCTSFTASAHKFGGPKGIGWLVDQNASSLQIGGSQEGGRRAGTENFPAIEGMSLAWKESLTHSFDVEKRATWRDQMEADILSRIPGTQVIGQECDRLWNTSLLLMPKFQNLDWVAKLDRLGFEVSTGSACSTGSSGASPTAVTYSLDAMESKRLLRVSSYLAHTQEDWTGLANAIVQAYEQLLAAANDSNVISL